MKNRFIFLKYNYKKIPKTYTVKISNTEVNEALMEVKLAKLTPHPENPDQAYGDFDIPSYQMKIKGCLVLHKKNGYVIRLPILKTHKGNEFTVVCFSSKETADAFFKGARKAVQETYPASRWKEGMYSKFKQGLSMKKK